MQVYFNGLYLIMPLTHTKLHQNRLILSLFEYASLSLYQIVSKPLTVLHIFNYASLFL